MNKSIQLLILICFILAQTPVIAQDKTELKQLESQSVPSVQIACGPWLQAVGEHEFTVVWTTNIDAAVWVEVAPDDGSHFYQKERIKYYELEYGRRLIGKLHRVRITGLEKGTTYRYRVMQQAVILNEGRKRIILGEGYGSDVHLKAPFRVTTLDSEMKEIKFSMFNDIHENDSLFRSLAADIKNRKTNFVIFNGDMLSQIEEESQIINGYLKSASELFASETPVYAIRGNHEYRGKYSWEFFKYFPNTNNNAYYTFRDGPAYFICLDCGEDKPDSDIRNFGLSACDQFREEQAIWLQKVVNSEEFKEAPVKIVVIHMPPAEKGWHGPSEVNRLFMPVLNNAGIDMMLCGHNHSHTFIEKGTINNNFPILINSNLWRTDVKITSSDILIKLFDASGNNVKTYSINK